MHLSIAQKIAVGFGVALLALLLIGSIARTNLLELSKDAGWVDHTFEVQKRLGSLMSAVLQAESSSRGYQLLPESSFQEASKAAAAQANTDLGSLRSLTSDNLEQQALLDRLEPLIGRRLEALHRLIDLRSAPMTDQDTQRTIIVRDGEQYMQQVRQIIGDMDAAEALLLIQRKANEAKSQAMTFDAIIYGSLLAFILVGVSGVVISRSITNPLRILGLGAAKIGSGNYAHRVAIRSKDEVGDLAAHFNLMAEQVQDRQASLAEQDWLKSGLTRFTKLIQGERDPEIVCRTVLSELAELLEARYSVLYVPIWEEEAVTLQLEASYACDSPSPCLQPGDGLVGQAFVEKKRILLEDVPNDYLKINSVLGASNPRIILVQPSIFEEEVKAVIELASFRSFTSIQLQFLDQLMESLGVILHTIAVGLRTEELLRQSEIQSTQLRSSELLLQEQQEELKQTNEELEQTNEELQHTNEEIEEKATLLAVQKKEVEATNRQIESAQQALEEKARQVALTSKYKSEFLANMSHELRTPLNSLLILSKMLAENYENNLNGKQVQYANTIYSSGNDLLELINEVLDLSKVESGAVEIDPQPTPFAELKQFVEQSFRHVADQKKLGFDLHFDPTLPATITTDARRLQQVLKNLLSNAFKFTENGSVTLSVTPARGGWDEQDERLNRASFVVAFAVRDTGIGIPKDKQHLIFEAFQQADSGTSRKYGGTGLGLSISREIAGLLGGSLQVTSTVGKGSTFTLFLPLTPSASSPEKASAKHPQTKYAVRPRLPQASPEAAPTIDLLATDVDGVEDDRAKLEPGDLVLLIIEDDKNFARTLMDFAREKNFKAVVARNVSQGVALASQIKPSAITLDIHLPDNDGWVVLDRLKHDPKTRHIPIHIISADEERERSLRLGAVSYFQKPVTKEVLDDALNQTIEFINRPLKNLLIIEDDPIQRQSLVELIGNGDVHTTAVGTAAETFAELDKNHYDCIVLDLGLPDMNGSQLIREIHEKYGRQAPPVIVYTGKELSRKEETELRMISDSIVIKNVRSPERLLDETALFLHRVQTRLPETKRRMIEQVQKNDSILAGRKVLVVDDDVRNIFAITSALEASQMAVLYAESGQGGIDQLEAHPEVEIVLMDVMMPGMDGFEAIRRIRQLDRFKKLPIISVTAKAMKGDREKCLEAGASDYITKPVDMDQLRSLLRVWLYQ